REEGGRRHEEDARRAVGNGPTERRWRHRVAMADVESVHQHATLVREEPDGQRDPLTQLRGHVRWIDAHRDHLNVPVKNVLVVASEGPDLRHTARSPAPAV